MVARLKGFLAGILLLLARGMAVCWPGLRRRGLLRLSEAQRRFHWEREHLEARFAALAEAAHRRGKPRWDECDFDDEVTYVRNRRTSRLAALVAISVPMTTCRSVYDDTAGHLAGLALPEELISPAARALRSATAVFLYDGSHWTTEATVIFNLNPAEAIRFYRHDLQIVGEAETAAHRSI